ncbi:unknown [Euproctis pseudoconspersa nucleopolyhedrovirus]|uniref:Ac55 n=1 Tax=Euproctis pseudoconspersa nucleopolyhedrovirus TaxID=307467 RepID=C3TWU3_9ABAC|nr:hypothetical protein EupsNPV_gp035 [Euproctis pseudoconspersa nucleopolyhedrovirus]ACO53485.1 unknown [Euproctis pseudoconspersa nucleopolyhedrovirus]QUJ09225.1 hypothetical protein Gyru_ORF30 [Gynaephora ruoergensis nucleopolyhedrovirus]
MDKDNCVNFKLKTLIDGAVDTKFKYELSVAKNLAEFYAKHKDDNDKVGRITTYDVVGRRNYAKKFDDKMFKL